MSDSYSIFWPLIPSDTVNEPRVTSEIYVGDIVAGATVTAVRQAVSGEGAYPGEVAVTFEGALEGTTIPIQAQRVDVTGTLAAKLVGLTN